MRAPLLARVLLVASAALISGCATDTALPRTPAADATPLLEVDVDDGKSPMAVLVQEEHFLFLYGPRYSNNGRTEIQRHTVFKVLSEAAYDAAEATVSWPERGALLQLDARTILPDGTHIPLENKDIYPMHASTAASDDLNENGWRDLQGVTFRFPRVEIGSLLELTSTVAIEAPTTSWSATIGGAYPVKKYTAEIVVEEGARPDLMVINKAYPLTLVPSTDGMQHLRLEATDIAPRPLDMWGPVERASAPWWIYRTVSARGPGHDWTLNASWDDVLTASLGSTIVKHNGLSGLPPLRSDASCAGDARCTIAGALRQVHDDIALDRGCGFFETRPVQEMLDEGFGSACDRTIMLWALLERAGVDAHIAGATRKGTVVADRTFPTSHWLNKALVVATVDGARVWLDPGCDACVPGELAADVDLAGDAVVGVQKGKEVAADWWPVRGARTRVQTVWNRSYTLTVQPDGGGEVAFVESCAGPWTAQWRADARKQSAAEQEKTAARVVRDLFGFGTLRNSTPIVCIRDGGCTRTSTATVDRLAAVDDDGLRIDLRPLSVPLDLAQREPRTLPLVVGQPQEWRTEVRVKPPLGMTVVELPRNETRTSDLVTAVLRARRDGEDVVVERIVRFADGTVPPARAAAIQAVLEQADWSTRILTLAQKAAPAAEPSVGLSASPPAAAATAQPVAR